MKSVENFTIRYKLLEEILFIFAIQQFVEQVPLNVKALHQQISIFMREIYDEDLKMSNTWIDMFKTRHKLKEFKISAPHKECLLEFKNHIFKIASKENLGYSKLYDSSNKTLFWKNLMEYDINVLIKENKETAKAARKIRKNSIDYTKARKRLKEIGRKSKESKKIKIEEEMEVAEISDPLLDELPVHQIISSFNDSLVYPLLEEALFIKILKTRMQGNRLNNEKLQEFANQFYFEIHMEPHQFPLQWILNFRKRYNLEDVDLEGSTLESHLKFKSQIYPAFVNSNLKLSKLHLLETGQFWKRVKSFNILKFIQEHQKRNLRLCVGQFKNKIHKL